MRSPIGLPLILSVVLILVIAGAAITHLKRGPEAAATWADPGDVSRLEASIAESAARIARLEEEIQRLQGVERGQALPDAPSPAPEANGSAPDAPLPAVAEGSSGKLEEWLDSRGMRKDLESFVAKVYADSRNARRQQERDESEAREKEMKELSEGPYGKFNYRVNSLAKKLELDERQKEFLFNLLTKGEERRREARKEEKTRDQTETTPEELEQRMKQLASLEQQMRHEFDREFLMGLSREQQEAYKSLPEEDHGGAGGGMRVLSMDGGAFFTKTAEVMVAPPRILEKSFSAGAAPAPK